MAYVYAVWAVRVTIFSTGGKFQPVSNFTELHTSTQAACSCALLLNVQLMQAAARTASHDLAKVQLSVLTSYSSPSPAPLLLFLLISLLLPPFVHCSFPSTFSLFSPFGPFFLSWPLPCPPPPPFFSLLLPLSCFSKVTDEVDPCPSKVLHWGGGKKEDSLLAGPQSSDTLVELGAKQIVASDKHCIVLTMSGLVYSLQAKSSGEYSATVSNYKLPVSSAFNTL